MRIGYARVSTEEQNLRLQLDALRAAGCDRIFRDSGISAMARERPGLARALDHLKPNDVLVVWKLDRLGRSLGHLIEVVGLLETRGIGLQSLSEAIDTTTAGGRLIFHVMGALAEFERELIVERTKAGMAAAKRGGIRLGRPPKLTPANVAKARAQLTSRRATIDAIARRLHVSPRTLMRAINKKEEPP